MNYRREPGFEEVNREALGEMLRQTHDTRSVDEFLQDILHASEEESRAWYGQAQKMRWAFGVVMDAIEDATVLPEDKEQEQE